MERSAFEAEFNSASSSERQTEKTPYFSER
ncbi:MAG: hypothetical protein GHCLOJNM_03824 [bacterium]|nr:hypothetical protein [bacterium]